MEVSEDFLTLYNLFLELFDTPVDGHQRVVFCYPNEFIKLAGEVLDLRRKNKQLVIQLAQSNMQSEYTLKLSDDVKELKLRVANLREENGSIGLKLFMLRDYLKYLNKPKGYFCNTIDVLQRLARPGVLCY